jgi:uncharacterized protein (TIGR00251 family)
MIAVGHHPDGAVIPVLAQPGAKRTGILGERAGALRIAVTSPPEKGKANQAIQALLAEVFACRRSQIALVSGASARQKRFVLGGMTPEALQERLASVLAGSKSPPGPAPSGDRNGPT